VNILAVALAHESQRFMKGYPPKGASLFLTPNLEVMRLAALLEPSDQLRYVDERVDPAERPDPHSLCLAHVNFGQENRARELAETARTESWPLVMFGPQVTAWQDAAPDWCGHRVRGDIVEVWPDLRADARHGNLKSSYEAAGRPNYVVPRNVKHNVEMNSGLQTMSFVRGCACPPPVRHLCPEYLYYGERTLARSPEEIVGELITLPRKRIQLTDDDVASRPDYYFEVFGRVRDYGKQWIVNASDRLFDQPRLVRLLAKAGTRVVYLNESFLDNRLEKAPGNAAVTRWLYRRVKSLQAGKMLVGARVALALDPQREVNYDRFASVLKQIDLDFLETRFLNPDRALAQVSYRPMVGTNEPAWMKNRFYSMEAINDRLLRRPRRVGFYTTALYLLPYSLAYRRNHLEGLTGP
jgi:hypothetical protein